MDVSNKMYGRGGIDVLQARYKVVGGGCLQARCILEGGWMFTSEKYGGGGECLQPRCTVEGVDVYKRDVWWRAEGCLQARL